MSQLFDACGGLLLAATAGGLFGAYVQHKIKKYGGRR
jgi:hypothetical protein